jgi:hypothetical protein
MMGKRLLLWLVLLAIGFLGGFIPQYLRSTELQRTLSAVRNQLQTCLAGEEVARLRDTAALMYLEATQKNYGTSAGYAGQFFEQAQHLASNTQNEALRNVLREVLQTRDQITADLAKADPAVVPEMQTVLAKVEQSTNQ